MPSPSASLFGATAAAPVGNPLKSAAQDVRSKQRKASWVIDAVAVRKPLRGNGRRSCRKSAQERRAGRAVKAAKGILGYRCRRRPQAPSGQRPPLLSEIRSRAPHFQCGERQASTDTGYACALRNFVSLRPRSANPASAPRPPTMRTSSARGGRHLCSRCP